MKDLKENRNEAEQEQFVKKLVELAEGFVNYKNMVNTTIIELSKDHFRWCLIDDLREWEHYPLLLYRARDGFNNQKQKPLPQMYTDKISLDDPDCLTYNFKDSLFVLSYKGYGATSYLTAQEQALEAALEEVLC